MSPLLELNDEQLRRLATLIHDHELDRIRTIPFGSEYERVQHLQLSKSNHTTTQSLLDQAKKFLGDLRDGDSDAKKELAHHFWDLFKDLVNYGMQAIRNYSVRKEFLDKTVAHADEILTKAREFTAAEDEASLSRLAKDAGKMKDGIKKFMATHRSTVSKLFSERINHEGISFEQLVNRYKTKRGLSGRFKDLSPEDRFEVYHDIIKDSGRGPMLDEAFSAANTELVAGFALMAFVGAATAWDIYAAPKGQLIERATKDMTDIAASIAGTTLENFAEAAMMDTEFALVAGAETIIAVVGFITGVAAGFVLSLLGGYVIDAIFNSGGESVPNKREVRIYVAPMPDGEALARQIAYS